MVSSRLAASVSETVPRWKGRIRFTARFEMSSIVFKCALLFQEVREERAGILPFLVLLKPILPFVSPSGL